MEQSTKPIKVVKEENSEEIITREEKYKNEEIKESAREEKYKEVREEDIEEQLDKEQQEEAEIALAQKNIAEAEKIIEEENKEQKEEEEPTKEDKKDNKKETLIDKFKKLTTVQKILAILIAIAVIVLIVTIIIFLLPDKKVEEQTPTETPVVEEAPTIVDNYYYKDGLLYLLDEEENEIGSYECENKDENLCYVAFNNYKDEFDTDKLLDENGELKSNRLEIINNEYAFIKDNKNESDNIINLFSISQNKIVNTYLDVKLYDENYVILKTTDSKYGLYKIENDNLNEIIKPQYSYLGMIDKQDNLVAKNNNGNIIIDKNNKVLSETINGTIKNYSNTLIVSYIDGTYHVYNYEGNLLASAYQFATVKEDYMALANGKNLYIKNKDNQKLNEKPISLKNTTYVREYNYDSEGKLSSTKQSFQLNIFDNKVEVAIYDDESSDPTYTNLNLQQPKVNANYKYINYFDGILYFYEDEEKEILIGSYACNNKNLTSESDTELTNCKVAKDTIYEDNEMLTEEEKNRKSTIPIINKKYAFIEDGTNTVYFVDLTGKTEPYSYTSVNTYTANNDYQITHYSGDLKVVGLNKKGKFGMFTITSAGANIAYPFNYNKMEKIGDYFQAQKSDNTWIVLFSNESTTGSFSGKVVNFTKDKSYFKIESNKYKVVKSSGEEVINEEFDDVVLYGTYFIGIKSSNLNLYNYSGTKITESSKKIPSTTCSLPEKYRTTYANGIYTVEICNGEEYEKDKYIVSEKKYESEVVTTPEPSEPESTESN